MLLTPHIGGSTAEAQEAIGVEVAEKLLTYSNNGSTLSAVNFPEVALPGHPGKHRVLHIHHNRPGMLSHVNEVFSARRINVAAQYLQTSPRIGYVVIDIDPDGRGVQVAPAAGYAGPVSFTYTITDGRDESASAAVRVEVRSSDGSDNRPPEAHNDLASTRRGRQQQGKRATAYEMLAPIYGWFTEGFDTKDLQEAKVLLEALA